MSSKSRDYCFTEYDMESLEMWLNTECVYMCIAPEVCPTTNRDHYQGYIYFKNPRSFSGMKKQFPKINFHPCAGSPEQNRTYIFGPYEKDGKIKPFNPEAQERGILPQQGKRTDVEVVREELHLGNGMRGVVRRATNLQQIKIAEAILKYEEPKRDFKPEVIWLWGLTGVGKSRRAHEMFEGQDFYRKTSNTKTWWEGYDAHENVIIDDMTERNYEYKNLLDLLDRYECRIECKGGTRQFLAKKIIITASLDPHTMFQNQDQEGGEILRRITEIIHCV